MRSDDPGGRSILEIRSTREVHLADLAQTPGRPDYGLDAPGVVRNLLLVGAAGFALLILSTLGVLPAVPGFQVGVCSPWDRCAPTRFTSARRHEPALRPSADLPGREAGLDLSQV